MAGPIITAAGVPVPAGLATLPLASDGMSFLITLAGIGFLFGAGGRALRVADVRPADGHRPEAAGCSIEAGPAIPQPEAGDVEQRDDNPDDPRDERGDRRGER
jgi:hypothetical protein